MIFLELIKDFEYDIIQGNLNNEINNLVYDSRRVTEGDAFVCVMGANSDGHKYIQEVCNKGAAAVIVQDNGFADWCNNNDFVIPDNVTVISVNNTRYALACASAAYFGYPAQKIKTIGITGTKGKTTTTYMVREVLEKAGIKTGLIGTIETIIGEERIPAKNTTPESYVVQETFAKMVESGCQAVVMEVSSQGLMLHRVSGFVFDYGIFTNLGQDHIGENEHKDFHDYMNCKRLLFKQCRHGIFNKDDEHFKNMIDGCTCDIETYGIDKDADIKADGIKLYTKPGVIGSTFNLTGRINSTMCIDIPGRFSVYNALCAIAVCLHFTNDIEKIRNVLSDVRVKGRVEIIPVSPRFTLMIDYAHNAMSLESLLISLKEYNPKRLVTVFGCGGNRSKDRRFEMGEVSSRLADFTIVTSDNPRFERPEDIINDIVTGVKRESGRYITIPDRKEAIRYAILNAEDGDVIILAGKGHEDYQEIEGVKYPMDERNLIKEIINEPEVMAVL
ncbi:MAG: UDP-N-acetylmuramoyl-L-alanyl-D-glutamate--2,6-diaminopimelate ligase [Eubacterium sp.]